MRIFMTFYSLTKKEIGNSTGFSSYNSTEIQLKFSYISVELFIMQMSYNITPWYSTGYFSTVQICQFNC